MTSITDRTDPVAKARIVLVSDRGTFALMSRKRAEGQEKHGKLEMLGGHLDADETPLQGLIRELREEEASGLLARIFEEARPAHRSAVVDEAMHHLFEIEIAAADCVDLRHDPEESIGLERIPITELAAGEHWEDLTWRTQRIFEAFELTTQSPKPI